MKQSHIQIGGCRFSCWLTLTVISLPFLKANVNKMISQLSHPSALPPSFADYKSIRLLVFQVHKLQAGILQKKGPIWWAFSFFLEIFSFTNQDNWMFRKSKKQLEKWFLFWARYKKQNHDFLFFSFTPARQISRKMKHLTLLEKLSSKSDLIWCYVS